MAERTNRTELLAEAVAVHSTDVPCRQILEEPDPDRVAEWDRMVGP
jgi:hypothetical protein